MKRTLVNPDCVPLSHQFPTPIAEICGNLERTGRRYPERLLEWSLLLYEATVRYTTAVLISAYHRSGVRDGGVADGHLKLLKNNQPTCGLWRGCVDNISKLVAGNPDSFSLSVREVATQWRDAEIPDEARSLLDDVSSSDHTADDKSMDGDDDPKDRNAPSACFGDLVEAIGAERDKFSHDERARFLLSAESLGPDVSRAVLKMVQSMEWMRDYHLFCLKSARTSSGDGGMVLAGDMLTGEAPLRDVEIACDESYVIPRGDNHLIFDPLGAFLPLHPLVRLMDCFVVSEERRSSGTDESRPVIWNDLSGASPCRGDRVFIYSKWSRDGPQGPVFSHLGCGTTSVMEASHEEQLEWEDIFRTKKSSGDVGLWGWSRVRPDTIHAGQEFKVEIELHNTYKETVRDVEITVPTPVGADPFGKGTKSSFGKLRQQRQKLVFSFVKNDTGALKIEDPKVSVTTPDGKRRTVELPISGRNEFEVTFNPLPELVGRGDELNALQRLFRLCQDGRARTAVLAGSSGVGKTALWRWFSEELRDRTGTSISLMETGCGDHQGVMGPLVALLREYFLQPEHSREARAAFEQISEAPVDAWPPEGIDTYSMLEALARMLGSDEVAGGRNSRNTWEHRGTGIRDGLEQDTEESSREVQFEFLEDLFVAVCRKNQATVFFIDDIHLLHKDSWEVFNRLVRRLSGESALLVVATQLIHSSKDKNVLVISDVQRNLRKLNPEWFQLLPLSRESRLKLLDLYLPGNNLEETKKNEIVDVVGGYPLWLRETVELMQENGDVYWEPGKGWTDGAPSSELEIKSLEDLIRIKYEKIKGEDPETGDVLDHLAVRGKTFFLWPKEEDGHRGAVAKLKDVYHLIVDTGETQGGNRIWEFTHARVHDTIYSLVERHRRAQLHAKIARRLEEDGITKENLPGLVYNWSKAGDSAKTLEYLQERARHHSEIFSHGDAAEDFERALFVLESHPEVASTGKRLEIQKNLARSWWLEGKRNEALELDIKNLSLASSLRLSEESSRIRRTLSHHFLEQGLTWRAMTHAETALHEARDERERNLAQLQLGMVLLQERRLDDAEEMIDACLDGFRRSEETYLAAEATRHLGIVEQMRGNTENAAYLFREAVRIGQGLSEQRRSAWLYILARAKFNLACLREQDGQLERAQVHLLESLDYWRELKDPEGLHDCRYSMARTYLEMGMVSRAHEIVQELSKREGGKVLDDFRIGRLKELEGEICLVRGEISRCLEACQKAVSKYRGAERELDATGATILQARAELLKGNVDKARSLLPSRDLADRFPPPMQVKGCLVSSRLERASIASMCSRSVVAELEELADRYGEVDIGQGLCLELSLEILAHRLEEGALDTAMEGLAGVVTASKRGGLKLLQARAEIMAGRCRMEGGDFGEARRFIGDGLDRARRSGDLSTVAAALKALVELAQAEGGLLGAVSYIEELLSLYRHFDDDAGVDHMTRLLEKSGARSSEINRALSVLPGPQ